MIPIQKPISKIRFIGFLSLICTTFCFAVSTQAQNPLVHHPVMDAQGKTLAFVYQGDIWTVDRGGSDPKRLTVHEAYDTNPMFTADGSQIVFQSNRYGNNDIFVVSKNGGMPKRLTYASSEDVLTDVTARNSALFSTKRDFAQVERDPEIFEVSLSGGTPKRLLDNLGFDAVLSPNEKLVAFTRGSCRIEREEYRGSANRDIWVYNLENKTFHQITTFQGNDFSPVWSGNGTLYFQSAATGRYNVHKAILTADGSVGGTESVTHFTNFGIFSYQLGNYGRTLIVSQMDKLFLVDTETQKTTPLTLDFGADFRFDPVVAKTFTSGVQDLAPSPNGKYSILTVRGELFLTMNDKELVKTVNLSDSPFRDENAFWLNKGTIIFTSDRNGVQNLYKITSSDPDQKDLFRSLKHSVEQLTFSKERIDSPVLSPDGKLLAYTVGRGALKISDISASGKLSHSVTLNDNGWDPPSGISWSPDSKWVAYSLKDLNFNAEIFVQKADNSNKPVNVSMHPKADIGPVWSDDGTKIGFSSNRNNSDYDVWLVWLQRENWEKTPEDWKESAAFEPDKNEAKEQKNAPKSVSDKEIKPISLDLEDIYERQVQVTRFSGGEFLQSISKDGKTFYYTTGNGTRTNIDVTSDLYKIQWDGKEKKMLTQGNTAPRNVQLDQKNEYLYYTKSGKPNRIKLGKNEIESIAFSAKMDIDYPKESDQIFEDAWKAINDGFYDPDFHGHDWSLIKSQYKPLAMKASTRTDFKFIFNWMLGQINASHMGMRGGAPRAELQHQMTGQLGIQIRPLADGSVKVTATTVTMPADKKESTVAVGSTITGVNGKKLTPDTNFYSLLNGTADQSVYLSLNTPKGESKEVAIRPVASNDRANYLAWVKERKRLTHKYSKGRLGYIHIQGMNWTSFEHFERELAAAGDGKEGLVIDVRYNGGGWTTDYLMTILTVRQHAYTIPRGAAANLAKEHNKFKEYYPFSERLPLSAWTKPSIALCNERSYSNAEIFSHAYKSLKIGTLVGQPTFGAVISTGAHRLIDGSYVRMPYRGWYVESTGQDMDYHAAVPDILVKNAPDEKAKKEDTQLKTAVEELLHQIDQKK